MAGNVAAEHGRRCDLKLLRHSSWKSIAEQATTTLAFSELAVLRSSGPGLWDWLHGAGTLQPETPNISTHWIHFANLLGFGTQKNFRSKSMQSVSSLAKITSSMELKVVKECCVSIFP